MISATIMAPQSQITAHVLRSLLSCPAPRKTWWCKLWLCKAWLRKAWLCKAAPAPSLSVMVSSLQVGVDHFDQLIRGIRVKRARILLAVDQMGADVVFHHLRHQARYAAANARDQVHDALAAGLLGQRALDRLDLAANAANASEQLFLFPDRMGHDATYRLPPC